MSKYNFNDCKPLENSNLTSKQVIALEHKYRLLLKKSGFDDIEMWDNKPRGRIKRVKFIKGHIRLGGFSNTTLKDAYINFNTKSTNNFNYYRVIGLFAYNYDKIPDKYRNVLQDLSITGNLALSIRNTKSDQSHESLRAYIKKNLPEMIKFVRELEDE